MDDDAFLAAKRATLTNVHSDRAVPVFTDRLEYIKNLTNAGWTIYMDGPSGIYFNHPDVERTAIWVGWEFDKIFYVERIVVGDS